MSVAAAYNQWADQYDTNLNKTRDLEAISLRQTLGGRHFNQCLEIGCGTGKNTVWLANIADNLLGVDLSENMLEKARAKNFPTHVSFQQADILSDWTFAKKGYDLITFSLVLEHIEDLGAIFGKCARYLSDDGIVYIGELHPFKQYQGSKARFETEHGETVVTCFVHNVSDFVAAASKAGLSLHYLQEYFDDNDRGIAPRILTMLFKKNA
jgi:predicted TPR repeat methyltransferase